MKGTKTLFSHNSQDWITPHNLWCDIRDAFQIELDPCGHEKETLEGIVHTIRKDKNGLLYDWGANTFINPPYSSIDLWVGKTIEESRKNPKNFYIILLPSRTDRPYFRKILQHSIAVCFISKRLKFSNSKQNAPFPSLMAVFTGNKHLTDNEFHLLEKYGYVI